MINFKKNSKNKNPYFNFKLNKHVFINLFHSYKLYLLILLILLIVVFTLIIISFKIWIFILLVSISYFSSIVDYMLYLPYSIGLGIPILLVLASLNYSWFLLLILYFLGLIFPRIQVGAIFEPLKLVKYLWLIIVVKIVVFLPGNELLTAITGILLVELVNAFINKMQYMRFFDIFLWNVLKNIILTIFLLNFLLKLVS